MGSTYPIKPLPLSQNKTVNAATSSSSYDLLLLPLDLLLLDLEQLLDLLLEKLLPLFAFPGIREAAT